MSTIELPDSAVSLEQTKEMFIRLDQRYGKPGMEKPKKMNGQYTLLTILKYLAYHRQSTCEEIAKDEYDKNLQANRKLKSITDDIRKFIKNNLIWTRLVREDGYKKVYNKQVMAYSLTPVGILYAIYLFSNIRVDEDGVSIVESGPTQEEFDLMSEKLKKNEKEYKMLVNSFQPPIDLMFVRSLAKEYSQTLPKVFGRFNLFEKIIGKNFERALLFIPFVQFFFPRDPTIPDIDEMLSEYAMNSYYSNELTKNGPDDLIAEQISLVFYANLFASIMNILDRRFFDENKSHDGYNRDRNYLLAKQKWMEILDEDKKIKKWYYNFVRDATRSKRIEFGNLNWHRKEIYSKNIMI